MRRAVLLLLSLSACGSPPATVTLEDWMRVGVEPREEAAQVERTLRDAGFTRTARVTVGESVVALGFARGDGRRAVRVVTARGVVAALDSHEPDGVRVRHGNVRLLELDDPGHDVDGDGRPEIVVAREEDGAACLAVLRVMEDGAAELAPSDAEQLAPGACVEALEDIDDDGVREAIVPLAWPELALDDAAPTLRAALVAHEGGWRARGEPVTYFLRERAARTEALATAHARLDVPSALRLAVELAALANLEGAALSAQVGRFDEALAGLVLDARQLAAVRRARTMIAAGWRSEGSRDTPAVRADGQAEEDPG